MLSRLIPRDEQFFDLFNQLAAHLTNAALLLNDLLAEPGLMAEQVRAIKDIEHKADLLTAQVNQRIDKSFITPIDREDIHMLASRLDDVIDLIDGTSRRFEMLHISGVREPARQLAGVLAKAADRIQSSVASIRRPELVNQYTVEIKHLE